MKIALDPDIHRHLRLPELCRETAELGYDPIELSPREDFLPWWVRPRAHQERVADGSRLAALDGRTGAGP